MRPARIVTPAAVLLIASLALAQPMGGISLHETGGPDMGSSYAGAGALASDATTAWLNPAGLTRLDRIQLVAGTGLGWANLELELEAPGTVSVPPGSLAGGHHCGGLIPVLGSFSSVQLGERLAAGLAIVAPYGGAVDYDLDFVGRGLVTEAKFFTLILQPTAAFEVTDWLSIGAGLDIGYGELEEKLLVDVAQRAQGWRSWRSPMPRTGGWAATSASWSRRSRGPGWGWSTRPR
jgi:long-chain fatty acid transport protein